MNVGVLEQALAKGAARLPGGPAAAERRGSALRAFQAAGLPSKRLERWRYTDLAHLVDLTAFDWLPTPPDAAALQRAGERLAAGELAAARTAATRLVFVDGHYAASLSRPIAADARLEVGTLAQRSAVRAGSDKTAVATPAARPVHPAHAAHSSPSADSHADRSLASLNAAFSSDGAWLRVPPAERITHPVEVVFIGSGARRTAAQPRLEIELGAQAALEVVVRFLDCDGSSSWLNLVTELDLADGASLSLVRLQEHGPAETHTELTRARLGRDAALTAGFIDLGGKLVRNDLDVELAAPGARADVYGVFAAGEGMHVDDHIRIDHASPATRSDELFRGVIGHRGRGVFNGKVIVRRGAQKTDARQSNDNLLLSEHAEIDTKPELEIYADDVKCSHGSTVGELDAEHLFYLRSRGLGADDARALLTVAFAETALERVADPELRAAVAARVRVRLAALTEGSR